MSAAVPVLTALLLTAFAGVLLQRYSPAFALLLSLGAAVWLLLRLAQPLRGILQAMVQLGQRTNAQAFSCLLRSAGILLLADYVRTLCEEAGADEQLIEYCHDDADGRNFEHKFDIHPFLLCSVQLLPKEQRQHHTASQPQTVRQTGLPLCCAACLL